MPLRSIGQLSINLIGDHEQVMFLHDLCDLFQIFPLHDRSGRVIWKWEHQKLGLGGQLLKKLFRGQAELVLLLQLDHHRYAVCQHCAGQIGYIAGLGDQYLIPRVDHSPHSDIYGFAAAHCHHDLRICIIGHVTSAAQIIMYLNL